MMQENVEGEKLLRAATAKRILLFTIVLVVTLVHFLLGRATDTLHILHIILAGFYFVPIIGGAVWFGLRGATGLALACSIAYYLHIRFSWANQPMENVNQYGWIATFWILGAVAGLLVDLEGKERERRLRAERNAEREAVIEGDRRLMQVDLCTSHLVRESRNGIRTATKVPIPSGGRTPRLLSGNSPVVMTSATHARLL